jgi:hypothetical protein
MPQYESRFLSFFMLFEMAVARFGDLSSLPSFVSAFLPLSLSHPSFLHFSLFLSLSLSLSLSLLIKFPLAFPPSIKAASKRGFASKWPQSRVEFTKCNNKPALPIDF